MSRRKGLRLLIIFSCLGLIGLLLLVGIIRFFQVKNRHSREISELKESLTLELMDRADRLSRTIITLAGDDLEETRLVEVRSFLELEFEKNGELLYVDITSSKGDSILKIDPQEKETLFHLQHDLSIENHGESLILRKVSDQNHEYLIESIASIHSGGQVNGIVRLGFSDRLLEKQIANWQDSAREEVVKLASGYGFSSLFLLIVGLIVLTATKPSPPSGFDLQWNEVSLRIDAFVINKIVVMAILLEVLLLSGLFLGDFQSDSSSARIYSTRNPINWANSVQLLLTGFLALLHLAFKPRGNTVAGGRRRSWLWILISLGFFTASLDEQFELHEALGRTHLYLIYEIFGQDWLNEGFRASFYWDSTFILFLYAAGAMIIGIAYMRENYTHKKVLVFFLAAILFQCVALFNENVYPLLPSADRSRIWIYVEECSELLGSFSYMISMLLSLLYRGGAKASTTSPV